MANVFGGGPYEQKSLLPVLLQAAREKQPERYTGLKIFSLLETLDEIENLLNVAGFWLKDAEQKDLVKLTEQMHELHEDITHESLGNGDQLFNYVPKTNYLWHLLIDNGGLNPHVVWCFAFEDFLKHIIRCSRGCVASTPVEGVGARVLNHYSVALDHSVSVDRSAMR